MMWTLLVRAYLFAWEFHLISKPQGAARLRWRSPAYHHYDLSIDRITGLDGSPSHIFLAFTCKLHPEHHNGPQYHPQMSSEGTTNLLNGAKSCDAQTGENSMPSAPASSKTGVEYSPENHRALMVMRSAKSARPFNSFADEDYKEEVEMLRPGTVTPHPSTISRDLNEVYIRLSTHIKTHLLVRQFLIFRTLDVH